MTAPQYLDILRLPADEIRRLLDRLEQSEHRLDEAAGRQEPRHTHHPYPIVLIEIEYPNDDLGTYRAVSRNISGHGLGFLHGKFVHPGSRCHVVLADQSGVITRVDGRIARCDHLEGRVHDVGMRFDKPVDISRYVLGPSFDHEDGDDAPPVEANEAA